MPFWWELKVGVQSFSLTPRPPFWWRWTGRAAGILAVADSLKDTAKDAVSDLKMMKLTVTMITGGNARSAEAIAR